MFSSFDLRILRSSRFINSLLTELICSSISLHNSRIKKPALSSRILYSRTNFSKIFALQLDQNSFARFINVFVKLSLYSIYFLIFCKFFAIFGDYIVQII